MRDDGGLGGYYWGVRRKETLLEQEKHAAETDAQYPPGETNVWKRAEDLLHCPQLAVAPRFARSQ